MEQLIVDVKGLDRKVLMRLEFTKATLIMAPFNETPQGVNK